MLLLCAYKQHATWRRQQNGAAAPACISIKVRSVQKFHLVSSNIWTNYDCAARTVRALTKKKGNFFCAASTATATATIGFLCWSHLVNLLWLSLQHKYNAHLVDFYPQQNQFYRKLPLTDLAAKRSCCCCCCNNWCSTALQNFLAALHCNNAKCFTIIWCFRNFVSFFVSRTLLAIKNNCTILCLRDFMLYRASC